MPIPKRIQKKKLSRHEKARIKNSIKITESINDFENCDLVIEAVNEELDLKKRLFAKLDRICQKETILASNTSALSVTELAASTLRSGKVLGIHFSQPAQIMKIVEVIRTMATGEKTLTFVREFCKSIKKEVVVVKDTPGFISNRSLTVFLLNAVRMLEQGCGSAEEIDKIHTLGMGHPKGPLELVDFIGLDTVVKMSEIIYEQTGDPVFNPPPLLRRMFALGWFGRKTGKGFYNY